MLNKARKEVGEKVPRRTRKPKKPDLIDQEEEILREATIHLIRKVGGLLVAAGIRQEGSSESPRWIITVTLRYPTGHDGYVGDLLYDGKEFKLLTEQSLVKERIRQIAADPERMRKWNEYRASTLQAGEG